MPLRLLVLATLAASCLLPHARPAPVPLRPALTAGERPAAQRADDPGAKRAWKVTLGSPSVTIAIVDTGVAPLAGLAGNLVPGHDFTSAVTKPVDGNGHGTAMASIAAARADGRRGVAGVCGLCSIMPVRVAGSGGTGTTALAADGVRWALGHGARVVNVSLASPFDDPSLDAAIEDAVDNGVVVVIAAGNGGSTQPVYPAAASPGAIVVGAVDPGGALFPWSSHGSWVQVGAPGRLAALDLTGVAFAATGTSAAAAYVSGTVGLMLSANPSLTPPQVQAILAETGTAEPGLDVASGRVVDAGAAVAAAAAL